MAGDTSSNIFINIDTSQAMAQLRALEKELTALNRALIVGTKTAAQAQSKYAQSLLHNVNATGQWTASMTRMKTATEQFATALDRSKLSLKDYFRYGVGATKTFGRVFGNEFDTVGKLVEKRVKVLQQQYVQLGRDAQGAMNALKFTPKALNYRDVTTQLMMATQRQQIFNKLIDDGSTKLLNFGKNTQWAGRQLMVGFTIPLMLFASQAIRSFKEIETQVLRFRKVYGDIFTDQGATDQALKNIRNLADEYTKYGLKVSETIKMAADAAAAGFSGKGLEDLVEQTNKLAVLGGVAQDKALETTIALRNAFQVDQGDLKGTIDFLNAVENQTVLALEDVTEAVPRVGPIIKQLGGDVKDLAFFLAAMKEGGVSAAQGANALKSGLSALINPSEKASKAAAQLGINLKGIVEENAGNLRNTVMTFAKALQPLTDLQQQRIIEQIFGRYQFARISALLNNITDEGTQAKRVLDLASASAEELAILSERELRIQAESPMNKFVGAVERLRKAIAPIGEVFAKAFTPIIEFITRVAEKFNNLPAGFKKAIAIILGVLGILGPVFLMTFGLVANGIANSVKGIQLLRKGFQQMAYGSSEAALKTQYLTNEELENVSVTNALYTKHEQLSAAYKLEQSTLASLIATYNQANIAMGGFAAKNPGLFIPGRGVPPRKFADGTTSVPGPRGAGDIVPSMLSPGEAVIPAKQSQKYSGFISQIIQDKVPGFATGLIPHVKTSFATNFDDLAFGAARGSVQATGGLRRLVGKPVIPQIPGLVFEEASGNRIKVMAGESFFYIKKESLPKLQSKLKEHDDFMSAAGRKDESLTEIINQITRPGRGVIPRAPIQGRTIAPNDLYKNLPKWGQSRNRTQGIEVANKRYDLLMKSRNPHLLKLKQYLDTEEKEHLRKVLPPDVFDTLNFDAKRLAPSHIREVGTERSGSWGASKIARDWDWFNKALIGTKMGNVSGGHPLNSRQAQEIIQNLLLKRQYKKSLGQDLSARQQGLLAALQYRVNRKPSFYDDFVLVDNAMMKRMPKPLALAGGIISVPGPKGAGDIQPAMLSPGEAVIPAKQSEKYMPLIRSIVADSVPGFAGSNINDSWGDNYKQTPTGIFVPRGSQLDDPFAQPSAVQPSKAEVRINNAIDRVASTKFGAKLVAAFDNITVKANNAAAQIDKNAVATKNATDTTQRANILTKQELKNARQLQQMNNAGKMMGIGMATSMLPMIGMAQASTNPEGFFARNMSSLMAVSMASMVAPMLNTPAKLLAAAAVSYAAVLFMQSKQIKKAIQEGRDLAKQFSMTNDKLEEFGTITGEVSITQEMEQVRLGRTTTIMPVSKEFGENFFTSDPGKKFAEDFKNLSKEYDTAVAGQISVAQLASAVNQGVLTFLQAESIITAMARDLKNPNLEFKMQGQLLKILGPDGEDLSKDPLKVQVELLLANDIALTESFKNFGKVVKSEIGLSKGEIGGLIGGAGAGALLAQGTYSRMLTSQVADAAKMASVRMLGIGATVGTIAVRVYQMGKQAERIGKAASVVQGVSAQNLQAVQQSMDAYNYQYNKQIQILQLEKDRTTNAEKIAKINQQINDLEQKRSEGMEVLKDKQKEILANYISMAKELNIFKGKTTAEQLGQVLDPVSLALSGFESRAAKKKLKEASLIGMQKAWGDSFSSKLLAMQIEDMDLESQLAISLIVESKAVTPEAMLILKKVLEQNGRDINQQINLIIETGGVDLLSRIATITERLGDVDAKQLEKLLNPKIEKGKKEEVDNIITAIEEYMKFPDTIPLSLILEVDEKDDLKKLAKLGKEMKDIKSRFPSGKIDLNALTKYQQELNGEGASNSIIETAIANWKFLETLPPEKRFQAIFSYKFSDESDTMQQELDISLQNMFVKQNKQFISGSKENLALLARLRDQYGVTGSRNAFTVYNEIFQGSLKKWKESPGGLAAAKKERERIMREWFGEFFPDEGTDPVVTNGDGGKATFDKSWMIDLAQYLKLFKEISIDALKPIESLKKFLSSPAGTANDWLQYTQGALGEIEAAAKKAGIVIDKNFMDIIRSLDADQFNFFMKKFLEVEETGKKGKKKTTIVNVNDLFKTFNEGFERKTVMNFIDTQKQASDELENQINAYKILTGEGWNFVEAAKAAEDPAFALKIVSAKTTKDIAMWKAEAEEYKKELERIIPLQYRFAQIKLGEDIEGLQKQIKAFDILNKAGTERAVILEIIKNKSFAYGIAEGQAFDNLVKQTRLYLDLLKKIEEQNKTLEQQIQEDIDRNMSALDLQQSILQNEFDKETYELNIQIRLAQDAVEDINREIQAKQDKIEAIRLEVKYKFDIPIEDLQEEINDLQRRVEEEFNRPIEALQRESAAYSRDLELMDRQAEKINEKYDLQEKALNEISQINQDIINQQKSQISLADALTRGDISAAAQAAQDMRAQAAEAASRNAGDVLSKAREAELKGLRSASGLTREQIKKAQLDIEDRIYVIEQNRLKLQDFILTKEDALYKLQEAREERLLAIRDLEIEIDEITSKKLKDAQKELDRLQRELELKQRDFDLKLDKINKERLKWEEVKLAFDKYMKAVEESTKGPLKDHADVVKDIEKAYAELALTIAKAAGSEADAALSDAEKVLAESELAVKYAEYDKDYAALQKLLAKPLPEEDKQDARDAFNMKYPDGKPTLESVTGQSKTTSLAETTKKLAENMKSASSSSVTLEAATQKIATSTNLTEKDLKLIDGYIKTQAEKMPLIVTAFTDLPGLIEKQIEPSTIATELIERQATGAVTVKDKITELITSIEKFVDSKNPLGMQKLLDMWNLVLAATTQISLAMDSYIQKIGEAINAAIALFAEIMKLNTTVTTTHIVNRIIYETVISNNASGSSSSGSTPAPSVTAMYGGMIKPKMYGGSIKPMLHGGRIGSDSVPILGTPGEFMVNENATKKFLPFLTAINESKFPSVLANKFKSGMTPNFGMLHAQDHKKMIKKPRQAPTGSSFGNVAQQIAPSIANTPARFTPRPPIFNTQNMSAPTYSTSTPISINTPVNNSPSYNNNSNLVYNYNVGINVGGSNATPDTIAKAVLDEIKYYNSQNIRSTRG